MMTVLSILIRLIFISTLIEGFTNSFSDDFTSSNLSIIVLDTYGQDIVGDPRIVIHMGIIDNGPGQRNYITDTYNNYDGLIAIELRGSSSSMYPKPQYRLETQDSSGNNLNVSLLDMSSENDWILYGPYDDQSLIRNVLAYGLSNTIGRYASRTRYCELVLNNNYQGLYILMEKIKRDNNRVNIASMDSNDVSGDAVTGGYIIKIDKSGGENNDYWISPNGIIYRYHYPKPRDIVIQQQTYIQNFMAQFENGMNSNPADPSVGYPAFLNIDTFVDHFILNELAKNVDAYRLSAFLYKRCDSNGGKLHAGPIWDFNLSFGKAWFLEDLFLTTGWQVYYNDWRPWDQFQVPFWWEELSSDSHFRDLLDDRWHDLRLTTFSQGSLFDRIDVLVDTLEEARVRNFNRWPGSVGDHSYNDEIVQLKGWIHNRLTWIDNNLGTLSISETKAGSSVPEQVSLAYNYPNPFNPITTLSYDLPKDSRVKLVVYDMLGNEVVSLVNQNQQAGFKSVKWNATDSMGRPVSAGVYLYQIQAGEFVQTKKMVLLK